MHSKNKWEVATRGECPIHKPTGKKRAMYLPLIDHDLIQEMNERLLSQEDRFLGQYLLPTKLQGLTNDVLDKMYAAYTNDLSNKREYNNEALRWKKRGCIQLENDQQLWLAPLTA